MPYIYGCRKSTTCSGSYGPTGIEFFYHLTHTSHHLVTIFGALHALFVEYRPENYTWMVAIAFNQPLQLALVFRRYIKVTVFIHYQHSQAVAGIKEFCSRRIVRTTVGIRTHLFEFTDSEIPNRSGNCHTYSSMILMVAGTF